MSQSQYTEGSLSALQGLGAHQGSGFLTGSAFKALSLSVLFKDIIIIHLNNYFKYACEKIKGDGKYNFVTT